MSGLRRSRSCARAQGGLSRPVLQGDEARRRYVASNGPCLPHLALLVEQALAEDGDTARFLVEDWRRRLEHLRHGLFEYRRKLDVRHAHEPRGAEQGSWTEAIRRYVGDEPRIP